MSKKKHLDMLVLSNEDGTISLIRKDLISHIFVCKKPPIQSIIVYTATDREGLQKLCFPLETPTLDNLYSLTQEYDLNPELFEDEQGS